jgi:hypothetical protein
MSKIFVAQYLQMDIDEVLKLEPFSRWRVIRSVFDERVHYEFESGGVGFICDEVRRIKTIFIYRGADETLTGIPFSLSRRDVRAKYGPPAKSGPASKSPRLGESGPWDRFSLATATLHIQYMLDRDEIELITLMTPGTEP